MNEQLQRGHFHFSWKFVQNRINFTENSARRWSLRLSDQKLVVDCCFVQFSRLNESTLLMGETCSLFFPCHSFEVSWLFIWTLTWVSSCFPWRDSFSIAKVTVRYCSVHSSFYCILGSSLPRLRLYPLPSLSLCALTCPQ